MPRPLAICIEDLDLETKPMSRLAAAAATAVVIGAVAATGGCTGEPDVSTEGTAAAVTTQATLEITIIEDPPSMPMCTFNDYRLGWVMDYADANNMLNEVFHPDSPYQYTLWDDATFRVLVDQAMQEGDREVRAAIWQQAEDILINDHAAVLPLYHYDRTGLIRSDIGYELAPFGVPYYMKWVLPEGRDTLRVHLTEFPILDPQTGSDQASQIVLNQLMEAPFRLTADGEIEPAGAESFEVSEDGTVYTVHLRRDATWSDGEPVTAQHYVDGVIRLLKPGTPAEYAYVMYYVSGADSFNTGKTDNPSSVGVRALDDYTLQFTLGAPGSFFDSILTTFTTYPVRLDLIEQYGSEWTKPGNFAGNGPYTLAEGEHGGPLVIEANPSYHSAGEVSIQWVEFTIIAEDAAALAAFERGELDISGYPEEERARILEQMPENFVRLPFPGTYYIGFNTRLSPTDNLNLRRALSSAIDRRKILDDLLGMPWRTAACGVIPPEIPGYRSCGEVGYDYDLEAAQAYLRAAMEELGVDDPGDIHMQLWFNRGNEETMDAIQRMWEINLGIDVNTVNMEWGVYLETLDLCND